MAEVIELRQDDHNGLCPKCHRAGTYLLVGDWDIWFICETHKLKWYVGRGLFGPWYLMTDEGVLRNEYRLAGHQAVKPFFHPRPHDDWVPPPDDMGEK
jgi:hypothetical protein